MFNLLYDLSNFSFEQLNSIDDFYGSLIPRFFESLDTSVGLNWNKQGNRFVSRFETDGKYYLMYIEEMALPTKFEYGVDLNLRCLNLGFSLINEDGEEIEILQGSANNPIKVFSIVLNGFKSILPIVIDKIKPDVLIMMISGNEIQRFNLYCRLLRKVDIVSFDTTFTGTTKNSDKFIAKTCIPDKYHTVLKSNLKLMEFSKI